MSESIESFKSTLDAAELQKLLGSEPNSIRFAARILGWSPTYVLHVVQSFPDLFDCIGVCGTISTYCIANTNKDRPIQLIVEEKKSIE